MDSHGSFGTTLRILMVGRDGSHVSFFLVMTMLIATLVVGAISLGLAYKATLDENRSSLESLVVSYGALFETASEIDMGSIGKGRHQHAEMVSALKHIRKAHLLFEQRVVGREELVLANRDNNNIHFLLDLRHGGKQKIPINSPLSEAMHKALMGQTGSLIGLDYRGKRVLAAYKPLAGLSMGLVAKIDLAIVVKPLVKLAVLAGITALLAIFACMAMFTSTIDPIYKGIRYSKEQQAVINKLLLIGLEAAPLRERLLMCLEAVLSVQWLGTLKQGAITVTGGENEDLRVVVDHTLPACSKSQGSSAVHSQGDVIVPINSVSFPDCVDAGQCSRRINGHCIYLPLVTGGKTLGSLHIVLNNEQTAPGPTDPFLSTVVSTLSSIMERSLAEDALRQSEERYALAAQGSNGGLWDWNLVNDEIYVSPRWNALLGYKESNAMQASADWLKLVHPDDIAGVESAIEEHLAGISGQFSQEYRVLCADNEYRWLHSRGLAVRDNNGKSYRMAGSSTDITDRKHAEQMLEFDALHDGLTGLANHRQMGQRIEHVISMQRRHTDYQSALLFLDLDKFKVVNDCLGHQSGDALLKQVSRALLGSVREGDSVGRLGGDEFILLLEKYDHPDDVIDVLRRLHRELDEPFNIDGRELYTSVSIGITRINGDYKNADEVLRDADTAMYHAKRQGGGRYQFFQPEMRATAVKRFELESHLRQAIDNNELEVHFQPIIALENESPCGFEALVRWNHPDKGVISPVHFIPVAEETGLIVDIGGWVLRQACIQMQAWLTQFSDSSPLYVTVNLSPRQLVHPGLFDDVMAILAETGLDPAYLRFEITENVIMDSAGKAMELLGRFERAGIRLCMDDFGTGYSSLSYLHSFPIDVIKIDSSFVMKMSQSDNNEVLVRTIINLASDLGLGVIAEGVETQGQLEKLRSMGCRYVQGFYFSRPLEKQAATAYIKAKGDGAPGSDDHHWAEKNLQQVAS